MAANLVDHQEIKVVKTISGNSPATRSIGEKAAQTFLAGTPVEIEPASGFIIPWDGATLAAIIAGVARVSGSNLATNAKGAPGAFGSVGAPATTSTFGSVPYQTSAVNIAHGAPFSDGRTLFEVAAQDSIFEAQIDNSAAGAYASLQTQLGSKFGMTKDATGHWYVDLNKTGANAVVVIEAFNPNDALGTNGARAWFRFLAAATQLVQ